MRSPAPTDAIPLAFIAAFILSASIASPQAIVPDPASIAPVVNPPNPQTNIVLSLADFTTENGQPVSTYRAFKAALDACRQQKAAKLTIPTGHYVFDDPQILQENAHIGLYSLSDLIIDGQGSELVCHFPKHGIDVEDTQRVIIRNLAIDTDLRLASLGVVHKVNGTTNIVFLNSYPVTAGTPFRIISPYDIANLKWKAIPGEVFDPQNVSMVSAQTFTSPAFNPLLDGEEVIVRHYVYDGQAVVFYGKTTADISCENITIYGYPGVGFSVQAQRGFRLSHCKIMQKAGRPISAAADGAHFDQTHGDILVEDCDFSGQGDDSLNITSLWLHVTQIVKPRTLVLSRGPYNDLLVQQGSQLKLANATNLSELARLNVTEVSYNSTSGDFTVTVDQDLPAAVTVGNLAIDLSQTNPRFLVRRNYFHDHRARGMLIQSPNGVVQNNRVENPTYQGLELFTDAGFFYEGPGPQTVIVENNSFTGCGYGGFGGDAQTMAAVNMTAEVPGGISDHPVVQNVLFDSNIISETPGLAMFVSSASGITISNNVIVDSNTLGAFPPWYGSAIGVVPHGSIMVAKASNVLLMDNIEINRYQQPEKGIYSDPATTTGISVQGNSQASPTAGGTISLGAGYKSGSNVTLTAQPYGGATFSNWTENQNAVSTSANYSFSLQANRNLIANFTPSGGQLFNISTRMEVQTASNVLIAGFIIGGSSNKTVLLRALGPTLSQFGITGALADPTLELHAGSGALIASNDNWKDTQQAAISTTGLAPPNDKESAILHTFSPGSYTAIVRGKNNTTGVALVEAYDIDKGHSSTLTNISTRGFVDTGQNAMIGGFIGGNGATRVIVRALGPTLSQFGVPNVLTDPTLEIHDTNGTLIASNDNWQDTQQAEIQGSGYAPPNASESAIIIDRPVGNSTAIVRGKNNTKGVALVEVYTLQ